MNAKSLLAATASLALAASAQAASHEVETLSDLETLVLHVGDTVALPAPEDGARYLPMDARVAAVDADGRTLRATDAGFSEILFYAAGATKKTASALAVVAPEPQGAGRVFLAKPVRDYWPWNDASKWTNLTDPSDTSSFPDGADDVAMVPLADGYSVQVFDDTVGELYIGWRYPSEGVSGGVRLAGRSGETRRITFRRSSGEPALLRITGVPRYDVSKAAAPTVRIGGGGAATGVTFEMPGGLVLDGGAATDWTDTAARDALGGVRIRSGVGQMTIPEGKSLRVVNVAGSAATCSAAEPALLFQNAATAGSESGPFELLGGGTFSYEAAGPATLRDVLPSFAGEVAVRNKQLWSDVNVGDQGGGFRVDNTLRQTTAPDASLRLEGNIVWTRSEFAGENGFSTSHANGAAGHLGGLYMALPNSLPGRALVLAGGSFKHHQASSGIGPKMPVAPTRADELVVEDGFSTVFTTFSSTGAQTNRLAFGSLSHAGRGTVWMKTEAFIAGGAANDEIVLGGFAEHAVGGSGAAGTATAPVVPWIVSPTGGMQGLVGFPSADANGKLVMKMPAAKALDAASGPDENVFVDGGSLALSEDRAVNSLVVAANASAATALGAGRTLTIASGGLALASRTFAGVPAFVGTEADAAAGAAGTVVFGGPAYVYAACPDPAAPDGIWASLVAPEGLSVSFPGVLVLGGDQTGIAREIAVTAATLRLGSATAGASIAAPVRLVGGGSRLEIVHPGSLCHQEIRIDERAGLGGVVVPPEDGMESCRRLYVAGESRVCGTWGSSESSAEHVDDLHFAGTGVLRVFADDVTLPTVIVVR